MNYPPFQIPMADDLGVYARLLLLYRKSCDQKDLALLTLARRVVLEKGRNTYKKKGEQKKVILLLESINVSENIAKGYASQLTPRSPLARAHPLYKKAGLV